MNRAIRYAKIIKRKLVAITSNRNSLEIQDEEQEEEEAMDFEMIEADPCISLHAMNGIQAYQEMTVTGQHGKNVIHILVDSESTTTS